MRPPRPEAIRAALARWERFPVDRQPRPIVVVPLDPVTMDALTIGRPPVEGIDLTGLSNEWTRVFDGPAVPVSDLPTELRSEAHRYCRDVQTGADQPLATIVRGTGPFGTDRGLRFLPAWMMYPDNRRWPFLGLDPDFQRDMTWTPTDLRPNQGCRDASSLAADGRTLTYRFTGTPHPYADYPSADVYETDTAVCVAPVELEAHDGPRPAYVETREVVVRLGAPLGHRVLVAATRGADSDACGSPQVVRFG